MIDGDFGIIAGHGRVLGAKKIGLKEVPCIFVEDLTEEQKRAYILADNKLSDLSGWDTEKLNFELENINFDMGQFGFDVSIECEPLFEELEKEDIVKDEKFIIKITFNNYKDWGTVKEEIKNIVDVVNATMVVGSV